MSENKGGYLKEFLMKGFAGGAGTYKTTAPVSANSVWTKQ